MRVFPLQVSVGLSLVHRQLVHAPLRIKNTFFHPLSTKSRIADKEPSEREKEHEKQEKKKKPRTFYACIWFHPDIVKAVSGGLEPRWIDASNKSQVPNNKYATSIIGRFTCLSDGCSNKAWSSGTVSILIKGYLQNGYNAVVFNQRCKKCKQLGALTIDKDSYIERVSYRIKKWAAIPMEKPPYKEKESTPHMRELCEGCKHGCCQEVGGNSVPGGRWVD